MPVVIDGTTPSRSFSSSYIPIISHPPSRLPLLQSFSYLYIYRSLHVLNGAHPYSCLSLNSACRSLVSPPDILERETTFSIVYLFQICVGFVPIRFLLYYHAYRVLKGEIDTDEFKTPGGLTWIGQDMEHRTSPDDRRKPGQLELELPWILYLGRLHFGFRGCLCRASTRIRAPRASHAPRTPADTRSPIGAGTAQQWPLENREQML